MTRAIREHLRDFIAIIALVVAGLLTAYVILANQASAMPSWVPLLGEERFNLKAELSTAQAVTPGQGQAVDIAGIQVGDITGVELVDGHAVVDMEVEDEYAELIKQDATLLLRPKTGLQDMVVEIDPGVDAEGVEEGETLPLVSTLPNANPDEFLAALDADTQSFLKLLLAGGGEALDPEKQRGEKLALALRQFEPLARDVARINSGLAQRRESISRSIHNFRLLSEELGNNDEALTSFIDSSNAVLGSFAKQEASIRAALRELPPTLRETKGALKSSNQFALQAAPALRDSLPGARALAPALRALRPLFTETVSPIRDQIRPFTRQVAGPVQHLSQTSVNLGKTVPPLRLSFTRLNEIFNALAANPEGADEGYLFYVPWLNHNTNNLYTLQDAHGPIRRAALMASCNTARLAQDSVFSTKPYIATLAQLTQFPLPGDIC
jgi:phospholipid/cholesterol/gamma-HCH transport system substrate-binding protein